MPSGRLLPVRYCGTKHSSSTSSAACLMSSHAVFSRPVSTCTTYHMGRPFPFGFLNFGMAAPARHGAAGGCWKTHSFPWRQRTPNAMLFRAPWYGAGRRAQGVPAYEKRANGVSPQCRWHDIFCDAVAPTRCGKTCHRLVFHLAIIHENNCCVVKMMLRPLHLRMQCSESTCFCNKRGFMWVFVKAVSYRAKGCSQAWLAGGASAYPRRRYSRFA